MAIFGWKKSGEGAGNGAADGAAPEGGKSGESGGGGAEGKFEFSPDKAKKFFERAGTLHEAENFEYAMNLWLRGLRFDPTSMLGLEGFFRSAGAFMNTGAKGPSKDTVKEFGGRADLDRYLLSLLEWSAHPVEGKYAVEAMQSAKKLTLREATVWIAERALGSVQRDKKPKKDHLVTIMHTAAELDRFDVAVQAGEAAVRLDPSDARLAAEVKNLSAESTMKRGGFDQSGEEGGFRQNIRDAAKQRQLEDRERIATTEETMDRIVATARADYETSPLDRPINLKYLEVLQRRGKPEDEELALEIAARAHAHFQEYRFREILDTVRVKQLRRRFSRLKSVADQTEASDEAKMQARAALAEFIKAEIESLEGQVQAYPTDLGRKFELAKRYFQVKRHEDAIGLLQEAKNDVKNRGQVFFYLGLSFQQIGWNDEAIETLRQAITFAPEGDEKAKMELQYGLMEALLARAGEQRALIDADEAYKLASGIAIQNINFKQIRARRDEIKALIASLKGGGGGGAGRPA